MANKQPGAGASGPCVCVVYTRFSPRPDASTSESCEVQQAQCEEYAFKKGWKIRRIFDDPDRSGADEFRPKLWQAIEDLRRGEVLLVAKRDRLARNVYLAEQIGRSVIKRGARIVACMGDVEGDGPEQVMVRQIVAAINEYERKANSMRTSAAMLAQQSRGRKVGGKPPYGWKVDPDDPSKIIENELEQKGLAKIRELRRAGVGYYSIIGQLDPAWSRCGKWYYTQVRRMVERLKRDGLFEE